MSDLAVLATNAQARLPERYEAARAMLAECSRIDECQSWADKAEALASYAKQANDDSLRKMADRIQARAIRRAGELLREFDGRGRNQYTEDGGGAPTTQREVAAAAGLSKDQQVTAVRVANVPEADFEAAVESDSPPTVTALAEQGKKRRPLIDLEGIPPYDFARATELQGNLRRLSEYCQQHEPQRIAAAFKEYEISDLRAFLAVITPWLETFSDALKGDGGV